MNVTIGDSGVAAVAEEWKAEDEGAYVEVRVPASTSNLGAGFDCYGLALKLYLTVRARVEASGGAPCRIETRGEGSEMLARQKEKNLIFRAMQYVAERENFKLPPVSLRATNEIPLGRGMGSSAAAIVAGITLAVELCGRKRLADDLVVRYGAEIEGHPDNIAASVYGGWVTVCTRGNGDVLTVKRRWPADIKLIVVSPDALLETAQTRAALPALVKRSDAVHNLQRAALFGAALEAGAYDLLWEAMQDCLHQEHRKGLVPGLADALAIPQREGLVGLALSGAGPSAVALARSNFTEIADEIARKFRAHNVGLVVRLLDVDDDGWRVVP